jgi:hypothetical protein
MKAVVDALNVSYEENEKRGLPFGIVARAFLRSAGDVHSSYRLTADKRPIPKSGPFRLFGR